MPHQWFPALPVRAEALKRAEVASAHDSSHPRRGRYSRAVKTDAVASTRPRQRRLRAFSYPGYGRLWSAAMLLALTQWMERLTVGWFVLDVTGSVFLTALSFAAQNIP